MAKIIPFPLSGNHGSGKWENVQGMIILSPKEKDIIRNCESAALEAEGVESAPEDIVIAERAIQAASSEAAVGILALSFVASNKNYRGVTVGLDPIRPEVLYFSSGILSEEDLANQAIGLIQFTDILLKLVKSPFRTMKDD